VTGFFARPLGRACREEDLLMRAAQPSGWAAVSTGSFYWISGASPWYRPRRGGGRAGSTRVRDDGRGQVVPEIRPRRRRPGRARTADGTRPPMDRGRRFPMDQPRPRPVCLSFPRWRRVRPDGRSRLAAFLRSAEGGRPVVAGGNECARVDQPGDFPLPAGDGQPPVRGGSPSRPAAI
jgi:hypothetical protein